MQSGEREKNQPGAIQHFHALTLLLFRPSRFTVGKKSLNLHLSGEKSLSYLEGSTGKEGRLKTIQTMVTQKQRAIGMVGEEPENLLQQG